MARALSSFIGREPTPEAEDAVPKCAPLLGTEELVAVALLE
jgi:hypothetical protein